MSNGPHKYGSGLKYGNTAHKYGEIKEAFLEDISPPATVFSGEASGSSVYSSETPPPSTTFSPESPPLVL